jgi:hypothetical protein
MGAEEPRLDLGIRQSRLFHQMGEEAAAFLRWRGAREAGPRALARIRCEGELGYQQQAPVDIPQTLALRPSESGNTR